MSEPRRALRKCDLDERQPASEPASEPDEKTLQRATAQLIVPYRFRRALTDREAEAILAALAAARGDKP